MKERKKKRKEKSTLFGRPCFCATKAQFIEKEEEKRG